MEFNAGDTRLILDAGTGIRLLGERIRAEAGTSSAILLLTHYHWDHIQGLPFFAPAYTPGFELTILGPKPDGPESGSPLSNQMDPLHFPVRYERLPATFAFSPIEQDTWVHEGVRIQAMRMRHPSVTFGYRLEAAGRVLVFIPDNEIEGGTLPTPPRWMQDLERFVGDADLLLHDAMFTRQEHAPFRGWGHSTYEETLDIAVRAGVKRLWFFHHAPDRSDIDLARLVEGFRHHAAKRSSALTVAAAVEGEAIPL